MLTTSQKIQRIKPSITLASAARAAELKRQGEDIIDLTVGEPDFDTPDFIKEAAIKAIHDGFTKYTAVDGIAGLKKAICEKFVRENQLNYTPDQIVVSCGAKQSIYNALIALLNPGDEVIIPAPYWVSYPDMVLLADGIPVFVNAGIEQNFKLSPQQLEAAITPQTRLLILNSPSNPSGMAYTANELKALAAVLIRHPHVIILTDDIYEHILWTQEPFTNIVNVCPELSERTIVVNGVSKAYAMTGWRIGYAAGPKFLMDGMRKVQSQSTSNPNSIAQVAAQAALNGDNAFIQDMVTEFKRRHDYIVKHINQINGLYCLPGDGTFYNFIQIQTEDFQDDLAFTDHLLKTAKISVVPGSGFGLPGYFRLSYATKMRELERAMDRLVRLFNEV